ncbi:MAG: hypothetical protein NC412_01535 [Roseburia sp.]|nr:hypothetical protein [Roseburia sp.]MCM1277712.1 hypothetical protein [Robinsoniella sp.]
MKKLLTKLLFMLLIIIAVEASLPAGHQVKAKEAVNLGTLSSKGSTQIRLSEGEHEEFTYIRFQPKKDGYVTFYAANLPENAGQLTRGTWLLCNSAKKEISSTDWCGFYTGDNITFVVKRNTAYFLKVKLHGASGLIINYEYKSITDKSGNKKAKAYKIKKKKSVPGLLMAGENKADWYKITLTKKQVMKIIFTTKSYRGIQMDVFDNKGNKINGLSVFQPASANKKVTVMSGKKLSKGTYYVKVYCLKGAKACGYYSLCWR